MIDETTKDFVFIYCISDVRTLFNDTLISINMLRKFVDRDNILVYYTPPYNYKNMNKLNKLAHVIIKPNITDEIKVEKNIGRYGDKLHALFCKRANIIFLDSDTFIMKDITEHLDGNFDFAGRVEPNFTEIDINIWNKMFGTFSKEPIPMINAGLLIFKNHAHNKITDEVMDYMNMELERPDKSSNQKDQYALSLAISNLKIRWLNRDIYSYINKNEFNGCILHGTVPVIGSDINFLKNRMMLRYYQYTKRRIIKW